MSDKLQLGVCQLSALGAGGSGTMATTQRPAAPTQQRGGTTRNEELDRVRRDVLLEEAANRQDNWHEDENSQLARQLRRLHASWLCYQQGNECLKTLCHSMMSLPTTLAGNWQALAGQLELTNDQIMSITQKQAWVSMDSAQLVIWTYSQNRNATLYQIVKSLQTIKRFDALQKLKEPLQQFVTGVQLLDRSTFIYVQISPTEVGADSQSDNNRVESLIAPKNYQRDITIMLPKSLQNLVPVRGTEIVKTADNANPRPVIIQHEIHVARQNNAIENIQRPTAPITTKPRVNVFLTFAADGASAATRVARHMRAAVNGRAELGVLILDENAEKVLNNPEIIINQLFPQFHYICPIITVGYLKAINSSVDDEDAQTDMRSALDSLDAYYVKFIHNLMMNEYTENNCRNRRFRCIIPRGESEDSCQQKIIAAMRRPGQLNPTLRAWAYERDLENFLRRLVGLDTRFQA